MARRRTLITYLAAYFFAISTALRGLIRYRFLLMYRGLLARGRVVGLLAAFFLLLVIEPWLTRRSRRYTHIYLAVQTGIISALLLTRPYEDFFAVLFATLSLQAIHVFPPRTGFGWIGVFTVLTAVLLIYGLGWREGLPRFPTYPVAFFACGLLIAIARQAEAARERSQKLLGELQDVHQRLQVYAAQAALINKVGQRVSGELELDTLLSEIVIAVHDAFDYHNVGLFLLDEQTERLTLTSIAGDHADIFVDGFSISIEEGMTGYAAATGETQVSGDVGTDPHYVRKAEEETRSELAVPITSGQKVIGVLDIQSSELDAFNESDVVAMETLSTQIATAIENGRLFEAEQRRAEQFRLMNELGRHMTSILDIDELLGQIARMIQGTFGYYLVEFGLVDGDEIVLRTRAGRHWDSRSVATRLKVGQEGIIGWVAGAGETLLARDVSQEPRYIRLTDGETRSELAVPIKIKGEVIGVLNVESDQLAAFDESDVVVLQSLANQAAVAIDNAGLYKAAQRELAERVRAEEGLREAKAAAEEARVAAEGANRAKSVFLANMSHELRTPLNAILGFSELMTRDPALTAEQRENLGTIGRSGEHLLALINDVLELSKIEAGRIVIQKESFDLHRMFDSLEEMFRLRAMDRGLSLLFDRTPDLPQYVRMDQNKLRQVLINLLGNAVKYTEEGGITLRAGSSKEDPVTLLRFEVQDTGVGIAPEELGAVFDPFVQTASGRQAKTGTGLGMPISRQFVRMMGGDLTVSSELGKGTIFKFDVRAELVDAADVETARPKRQVLGLEPGQPVYRLLVVEDRDASRKLLVKLLQPLGFQVREATNGQEAIKVWEDWEPHLIWMDMRMPVMDGHEATVRIKTSTKGQATVIIALTASVFEEERAEILAEGCDDFLRKPFRETEIYDKLAAHLGVRFVYDGAVEAEKVAEEALTPAALAAMPAEWVADLYQAAMQADGDLVLNLLDSIRESNGSLADALASLVHDFRFDLIVTLTQASEE
jgi:signal transduction histidine kinase/FixJ family two-component response regulator